ncbi:hypothetical protein BUALT_Bualt08G0070300 [Buddleja alternifolia]|uniref:Uncharacterized protein n=1 Tax=Buddleja alternifolia TaxID=168488 RepID=A0AAV6XFF3_9LAMI|nr:hypothetical protein BUALT_Bualt08G0070300 [Buddleja alternifolia]
MSPPITSLISATPSAAHLPLTSPLPQYHTQRLSSEIHTISRRNAAVLLSSIIAPLLQPPLASAFSVGISGPKEWLKEQKKKSAKFLLAPVDASRNILQSAYLLLMRSEAEFGENDFQEVQKLFVSAARDCVAQDRNSLVEFQANTGVEVCTFRLIVKNASSLLDDRDPLKLEAEAKLNDLIRSFSSLNGMAREGGIQLTSNRQRVADALKDTISSLNNFEQGIKECLQV